MRFTLSTFLVAIACAAGLTSAAHASAHPYRHRRHHARTVSSAAVSAAEALNKASAADSVPTSEFAGASNLPASALAAAALKLTKSTAKYQVDQGSKTWTKIYTDWSSSSNGSAIVFTSNMDIDCDGTDYECKGNSVSGDGQDETSFGKLAAYEVPWIVIPQSFQSKNEKLLPGNNIAAVICAGKIYYGIFGDTNGAGTEVIGEASWRMGQACFPDDNISGENGHGADDVTYIVFTGTAAVLPTAALTTNYITNFKTLKSMGDELMGALVKNAGISGSGSGSSNSTATASGAGAGSSSKAGKSSSAAASSKTSSSKKSSTETKTASSAKATATGLLGDVAGGVADSDDCDDSTGDAAQSDDDC